MHFRVKNISTQLKFLAWFVPIVIIMVLIEKNGVKFSTNSNYYRSGDSILLTLTSRTLWTVRYVDGCSDQSIGIFKQIPGAWEMDHISPTNCQETMTRKFLWPFTSKTFELKLPTNIGSGTYKFDIEVDPSFLPSKNYTYGGSNLYNERSVETQHVIINTNVSE